MLRDNKTITPERIAMVGEEILQEELRMLRERIAMGSGEIFEEEEEMLREVVAMVGEEILQEEEEAKKKMEEEYKILLETEEEILWSFEYMEGEIDNIIADGYDPIVEAELIREEIIDTLEEISYVLYDRDLTVEDLLEDVRDKFSDARQRGKDAEFEIEFWNEEYGIIVYRLYEPMYRSSYNILWF